MKKIIDIDKAIAIAKENYPDQVGNAIRIILSVYSEPIVMCEHCRWWLKYQDAPDEYVEGVHRCCGELADGEEVYTWPDDYCSYGERRR